MTTNTATPTTSTAHRSLVARTWGFVALGTLVPVVLLPLGLLVPLAVLGAIAAASAALVRWVRADGFSGAPAARRNPHDRLDLRPARLRPAHLRR